VPSTVPSTRSGSCKSHSTQPSLPHRLCQRLLRQVIGPVANGRIIACIHAPLDLVKRAKLSQSSGLWPTPTQITPWLEAMWRRIGVGGPGVRCPPPRDYGQILCLPSEVTKHSSVSPRPSPRTMPSLCRSRCRTLGGWILACPLLTSVNLNPGVRFFSALACVSAHSPCLLPRV